MNNHPTLRTNLPPFVRGTGSAHRVGQQIAGLYERLADTPAAVADVWQAATAAVGVPPSSSLYKAGLRLSEELDAGKGTGIKTGYHNTSHFVEVLLNTTNLIQRQNDGQLNGTNLSKTEKGELLFAALAHDFHYEPGGNKDASGAPAPYRLEKIAITHAEKHLKNAKVSDASINNIRVMILGTDVSPASGAGAFVRAAHDHHFNGAAKPALTNIHEEIAPLVTKPKLALMAAMLGDADILSSTGLTVDYSRAMSNKLGTEWNKPMGAQDTLGFLKYVAGNRFTSAAATFFQPSMDALRKNAELEAVHGLQPVNAAVRPAPQKRHRAAQLRS